MNASNTQVYSKPRWSPEFFRLLYTQLHQLRSILKDLCMPLSLLNEIMAMHFFMTFLQQKLKEATENSEFGSSLGYRDKESWPHISRPSGLTLLTVNKGIIFKILLITFKALWGLAPGYISELLPPYRPSCNLRSKSANFLAVPTCRTKTYGERAFAVAESNLWNQIHWITVSFFKWRHFYLRANVGIYRESQISSEKSNFGFGYHPNNPLVWLFQKIVQALCIWIILEKFENSQKKYNFYSWN